MNNPPLFTLITLAYCRFNFTQLSLKAMQDQTYKNLEIIVVNNGATPEITDYLIKAQALDNRIKIIHFSENQFSKDDLAVLFRVCFSAALKAATGDYVFYQSDDDLISNDYVEKMVKLFRDNPNCTSASGAIKCIDEAGRITFDNLPNYRPRYMPGHLLALSTLCQGKYGTGIMFSSPGCIFTFKRGDLIKAGGYCMATETRHLYGIVPFGVTGFDETAFFYWRHHKGQANVQYGPLAGYIGIQDTVSLIKDWHIEEHWQVFGKDVAQYVVRRMVENIYGVAISWFVVDLYFFRFKACWRILKEAGNRFYFWRHLPVVLWTERRQFWYYLKSQFRRIFEAHPWLTQKFSFLMPLKARVLK